MHVILFGLGLILSAAGLAVVAYGFREIEFTIGTTLILAGTVAGTGGLLLLGLAAAVHHLRRIAGIQAPRVAREVVAAEPQPAGSAVRNVNPPAPAKIPFPPRPQPAEPKISREPAREPSREPSRESVRAPEPRVPEPRIVEPDLGPASDPIFGDMLSQTGTEYPPEPRIEPRAPHVAPHAAPQAAPQIAAQRPVEPPMVEDHDDVPLSPRPPAKVSLRHAPAPPLTRVRPEPRPISSSVANDSAAPSSLASSAAVPSAIEETRAEAADQQPVNFDSLWPAEKRPGRPPRENARAGSAAPAAPFVERRGEAARRETVRPEPPRRSEEAARAEPVRAPSSRAEPPALRVEPAPLRTEPVARVEPAQVRAEPYVPGTEPPALRIESEQSPAATKSAEPPRAIAILKSGVVDGMAYTLYADGSIEAQLPAGMLRFGSIAELREHIEKNS